MDTSEVSLMGETLGGVIIDNGVPIYYGSSGEISPPKLVTGLAAELFPGTMYTESTFPSNMQTIRTYTQVTESGTGIPLGSVAGTAEISSSIDYYYDREVIRTETNFMDATGRSVAAEISETYADTGEPTGAGGQSRWTVIHKLSLIHI